MRLAEKAVLDRHAQRIHQQQTEQFAGEDFGQRTKTTGFARLTNAVDERHHSGLTRLWFPVTTQPQIVWRQSSNRPENISKLSGTLELDAKHCEVSMAFVQRQLSPSGAGCHSLGEPVVPSEQFGGRD